MRSVVTIKSGSFNLTESKPYFINEACFGDDLARWLIGRFRERGVETDQEPGQEDFGWYFGFRLGEESYRAVIGNVAQERWFIVVERACGLLAAILGQQHRKISLESVLLVHEILGNAPAIDISEVAWFDWTEFRKGTLAAGSPSPTSVSR